MSRAVELFAQRPSPSPEQRPTFSRYNLPASCSEASHSCGLTDRHGWRAERREWAAALGVPLKSFVKDVMRFYDPITFEILFTD